MSSSPDLQPRRRALTLDADPASGNATATTIAIVSEDKDFASACERVLRSEGYLVQSAVHSGHVMLACLRGQRIDVLVSDMAMEEGSGPALARRMRRYNPDLRAIYIAKAGILCVADNVLIRPFTREDLLTILRRQLPARP